MDNGDEDLEGLDFDSDNDNDNAKVNINTNITNTNINTNGSNNTNVHVPVAKALAPKENPLQIRQQQQQPIHNVTTSASTTPTSTTTSTIKAPNNNVDTTMHQQQRPAAAAAPINVHKQQQQQQQQQQQTAKNFDISMTESQSTQYTSDLIQKGNFQNILQSRHQHFVQSHSKPAPTTTSTTTTTTSAAGQSTHNNNNDDHQFIKPKQPTHSTSAAPQQQQRQTLYKNDEQQPLNASTKRIKNDQSAHISVNPNVNHNVNANNNNNNINNNQPVDINNNTPTRRFPGPAGSLPPLKQGQTIPSVGANKQQQPIIKNTVFMKATIQDSFTYDMFPVDYSKGPWVLMLKNRGLPPFENPNNNPLLKYNIDYVLREGYQKKVPQLVVMIKSLVASEGDYQTVISDPSGEMKGIIQKKIVGDYYPELANGWILVLRKTSVFSPSPTSHYINIVISNIDFVYSPNDPGVEEATQEFEMLQKDNPVEYNPKSIYQDIPIKTQEQIEKELIEKKMAKKLHADNLGLNPPPPPPNKKTSKYNKSKPSYAKKQYKRTNDDEHGDEYKAPSALVQTKAGQPANKTIATPTKQPTPQSKTTTTPTTTTTKTLVPAPAKPQSLTPSLATAAPTLMASPSKTLSLSQQPQSSSQSLNLPTSLKTTMNANSNANANITTRKDNNIPAIMDHYSDDFEEDITASAGGRALAAATLTVKPTLNPSAVTLANPNPNLNASTLTPIKSLTPPSSQGAKLTTPLRLNPTNTPLTLNKPLSLHTPSLASTTTTTTTPHRSHSPPNYFATTTTPLPPVVVAPIPKTAAATLTATKTPVPVMSNNANDEEFSFDDVDVPEPPTANTSKVVASAPIATKSNLPSSKTLPIYKHDFTGKSNQIAQSSAASTPSKTSIIKNKGLH
ncbi:hypothetical protein SAMD00019534_051670 [Acytostelium subglobosum LB1]|uniref:hypothetical protein n=1 Tax=Acytostelium subglobosum LB1 TaxID=1410327 RepID=UPI000644ED68|nr:hypothetical protein SAMD00019534_051670 [Acytostelium subglobosum LB1]GAM21992.1 hypothetical protein SAMD00019534_051670 [Acytostelium subglobosum LB1]|eukprot:XP_012755092.1 hypothetical protein SAMD00019534_051670 [Acytostelium subglobosum LB1]